MCSGLLGCQTLGDCKELTSAMSHLRVGFPSITKEWAFPGGSVGKEFACNAGDTGHAGLIPRSGRSPGVGNGNPLQYSCLKNSMVRGAWRATVHGITKSQTQLNP